MFGSTILEVAIGLAFAFVLLSLVCSAMREAVEGWMKSRAADLERGIRRLLASPEVREGMSGWVRETLTGHRLTVGSGSDPRGATTGPRDVAIDFYAHPLIRALYSGASGPSYIPAKTFFNALWDLVTRSPEGARVDVSDARSFISVVEHNTALPAELRTALVSLARQADGSLETLRALVTEWFDGSMDRVSGWYKRRTQYILFGLGCATAVVTNADTIRIADTLARDTTTRALVVASAEGYASMSPEARRQDAGLQKSMDANVARLQELGLPVGWKECSDADWAIAETSTRCRPWALPPAIPGRSVGLEWIRRIAIQVWAHWLGWLLTAFAITLGAPFWFDTLNKIMVIRSTVKPREKSPEEASEDRQR